MRIIILALITFSLISCLFKRNGGELVLSKNADIVLLNLCIDKFTSDKIIALKRYLGGNPRWEVLNEHGKLYAIRKEKQDGKYLTSLNGYYLNFEDSLGDYESRVIISFGQYYGFGNDESGITFTDSKDKQLSMIIEGKHDGSPGNTSYLIIKSANMNIEIYEQAKNERRNFTQRTIGELNDELSDVLKYEKEINENGIIPISTYYPFKVDSLYFDILDGMQPGIYVVQAGISVDKNGIVYTKAFNSNTNERLSADRITPRTTRRVGWSKSGRIIFHYESELTVYEGDLDHQYNARFEIWFKDEKGKEKKLLEKSKQISGWER
jgi:hypothetical protein